MENATKSAAKIRAEEGSLDEFFELYARASSTDKKLCLVGVEAVKQLKMLNDNVEELDRSLLKVGKMMQV